MKILYICGDRKINPYGSDGKAKHINSTIKEFRRQGHEVKLFSRGRNYEEISDILKEVKPKTFQLIYERYCLYEKVGETISNILNIPRILEFNYSYIYGSEKDKSIKDKKNAFKIESETLKNADGIITVSKVLESYLKEIGVKIIKVAPVSVDKDEFDPKKFLREKKIYDIGFIGSFQEYHGLEILAHGLTEILKNRDDIKFSMPGKREVIRLKGTGKNGNR